MSNNLKQIDHIVVLMLENRSFDHMLGYLSLEGNRPDIDGLTGREVNKYRRKIYNPQLLSEPIFPDDPHHDWDSVRTQLKDKNSGFIRNFGALNPRQPERIMHYLNATHLHAFHHLAKQFCICDRWFSSVPGPTQPNRVYSLCGHTNGRYSNISAGDLIRGIRWDIPTIFEFLPNDVEWKYYSHDIATLRMFKKYQYHLGSIEKIDEFFARAEEGNLPNISWIDPDFGIPLLSPGPANDDHPPHDVRSGQNLVSRIYNALLRSGNNQWEKTLFIIVYDEHGGFYDHVSPDDWTPADDRRRFQRYGVRVPAFVISPWVGRQTAYGSRSHHLQPHEVIFDHTSILKTILRRFCEGPDGTLPWMSARVNAANDLSALLTETQPRADCTSTPEIEYFIPLIDRIASADEDAQIQGLEPRSELQQSLEALADDAMANGVSKNKL